MERREPQYSGPCERQLQGQLLHNARIDKPAGIASNGNIIATAAAAATSAPVDVAAASTNFALLAAAAAAATSRINTKKRKTMSTAACTSSTASAASAPAKSAYNANAEAAVRSAAFQLNVSGLPASIDIDALISAADCIAQASTGQLAEVFLPGSAEATALLRMVEWTGSDAYYRLYTSKATCSILRRKLRTVLWHCLAILRHLFAYAYRIGIDSMLANGDVASVRTLQLVAHDHTQWPGFAIFMQGPDRHADFAACVYRMACHYGALHDPHRPYVFSIAATAWFELLQGIWQLVPEEDHEAITRGVRALTHGMEQQLDIHCEDFWSLNPFGMRCHFTLLSCILPAVVPNSLSQQDLWRTCIAVLRFLQVRLGESCRHRQDTLSSTDIADEEPLLDVEQGLLSLQPILSRLCQDAHPSAPATKKTSSTTAAATSSPSASASAACAEAFLQLQHATWVLWNDLAFRLFRPRFLVKPENQPGEEEEGRGEEEDVDTAASSGSVEEAQRGGSAAAAVAQRIQENLCFESPELWESPLAKKVVRFTVVLYAALTPLAARSMRQHLVWTFRESPAWPAFLRISNAFSGWTLPFSKWWFPTERAAHAEFVDCFSHYQLAKLPPTLQQTVDQHAIYLETAAPNTRALQQQEWDEEVAEQRRAAREDADADTDANGANVDAENEALANLGWDDFVAYGRVSQLDRQQDDDDASYVYEGEHEDDDDDEEDLSSMAVPSLDEIQQLIDDGWRPPLASEFPNRTEDNDEEEEEEEGGEGSSSGAGDRANVADESSTRKRARLSTPSAKNIDDAKDADDSEDDQVKVVKMVVTSMRIDGRDEAIFNADGALTRVGQSILLPGQRGLFARQDIALGQLITWYTGRVFLTSHSLERHQQTKPLEQRQYCFEVMHDGRIRYYIDGSEPDQRFGGDELCAAARINHHPEKCNTEFEVVKVTGATGVLVYRVAIMATCPIKAGEELLIHYGENFHQSLVDAKILVE